MRGDQHYPQPHLYCQYGDAGEPYEMRGYFAIREDGGHEYELSISERIGFEALLKVSDVR